MFMSHGKLYLKVLFIQLYAGMFNSFWLPSARAYPMQYEFSISMSQISILSIQNTMFVLIAQLNVDMFLKPHQWTILVDSFSMAIKQCV